jgi:hypothetical protein
MIVKVDGKVYSEIYEIVTNEDGNVVLMQAMCPQGNPIELGHVVNMEVTGGNDF